MPITPFLDGHRFDRESERVLGVAFEMVCVALRTGDYDDGAKQAIATKLIALTKADERNPDILRRGIEGHSPASTVGRLRSRAVFGAARLLMRTTRRRGHAGTRDRPKVLPRGPSVTRLLSIGPGTPPRLRIRGGVFLCAPELAIYLRWQRG
jgi:hypothetical protein